jgi:hypothetical protein
MKNATATNQGSRRLLAGDGVKDSEPVCAATDAGDVTAMEEGVERTASLSLSGGVAIESENYFTNESKNLSNRLWFESGLYTMCFLAEKTQPFGSSACAYSELARCLLELPEDSQGDNLVRAQSDLQRRPHHWKFLKVIFHGGAQPGFL